MNKRSFNAFLTIIVLISVCCINVCAHSAREKGLDYPYRAMGGLFEGCIVSAENGILFSEASTNFIDKKLTVYNKPYAIEEGMTESGYYGGPEVPLFKLDDEYKTLCCDNIKKYLEKVGEKGDGEFRQMPAIDYQYYYSGQHVNVTSIGSRMSVSVKNTTTEYVTEMYENGRLTDDPFIKAALEMAGCVEFSYTRTDYKRDDGTDGGIYYLYPDGAKDPQPYLAKIEFSIRVRENAENESSITVDFQFNGYEGYEYGKYEAISYKEAFRRLKNNDYRSLHFGDDLSEISESDVLCELVYTDAIDLHYMIPCYKFYVEVKDEAWLTQEHVADGEKMYFFYYVPAVDMNINPGTGDNILPVAVLTAVAVCALSLPAAVFKKKQKRYM